MKTLLIIDGHYHLYRFYNGIPKSAKLPDGTQVNAVYGFIAMLRRLLANYENSDLLVVFDSETGTTDKIHKKPEYKNGRELGDGSMFDQLEILKILLDDAGITCLEEPKHEGDDVICSLTQNFYPLYKQVYIVSNDKDFFQLVDDKVNLLKENNGKITQIDPQWVTEKLQINPKQYLLYLSLVGDKSDNIKGINGIGPTWASRIIGGFRTLDEVLDNSTNIPIRFVHILKKNKKVINENIEFLKMKGDINFSNDLQGIDLNGLNKELLHNTNKLLNRNGFGNKVKKQ